MTRILAAVLGVAAAVAVPAGSAHATPICLYPVPNNSACVEVELSPVSGGYTTASTIWVTINGTTYCIAVARTTVAVPPYHDLRTVYFC